MSKKAMIWGATGGIGLALIQHLSLDGWQVAAAGRNLNKLEGLDVNLYEADFGSPQSIQTAVAAMAQELDEVNLWVYAAGDILSKPVSAMDLPGWQRILDANLNGLFLALHHSLPLLASDAAVYILGAQTGRLKLPGMSAYVAAKAAVDAFADVLRKELRRRVIVVQPAAVDTPLWDKVPFKLPPNAMTPQDLAERIMQHYHSGSIENPLVQ